MMLISISVPATAIDVTASPIEQALAPAQPSQSFAVSADAVATTITRDGYGVTLPPPPPPTELSVEVAGKSITYLAAPAGTVGWPFPDGSPISSGFGPRNVPNCAFCSTNHQGIDFTPGEGVAIHAIATGRVADVILGGPLGDHVVIDHLINGQKVTSVYGHMLTGSIIVKKGDQVILGQPIGAVGSTGNSTGAHLHLEVHLDGTPVDPMAWLTANVG